MIDIAIDSPILATAVWITVVLFAASLVCASIRLAIGPSLPDRVVALDLAAVLVVGFVGVFAIATGRAAYLDVAIALALVAFLGTVALARYVERVAAAGIRYDQTRDPTL